MIVTNSSQQIEIFTRTKIFRLHLKIFAKQKELFWLKLNAIILTDILRQWFETTQRKNISKNGYIDKYDLF